MEKENFAVDVRKFACASHGYSVSSLFFATDRQKRNAGARNINRRKLKMIYNAHQLSRTHTNPLRLSVIPLSGYYNFQMVCVQRMKEKNTQNESIKPQQEKQHTHIF